MQLRRGFTLVEMIIYVGLLSFVFVSVINISLSMSRSYASLKASKNLNTSASVALERMVREIRLAESVSAGESLMGAHPGRLTLNTRDSLGSQTTVEFYLDNGIIKIKEGGIYRGQLSLSEATTTSLVFNHISASSSEAVRVVMTVASGENERWRSETFYATAILRGSY